jgi:hypothetical protein
MPAIQWRNEKRRLSDLIPWPRNPRQIKGAEVQRLQESLEEFGQVEPTAIGPNNELYNGHQRLKSWAAKFGDIEIDVRVSSRPLTEKEREKLTIFLHKGTTGGWDFDALANGFEVASLVEWGFKEYELGIPGMINDPNEEWKGMPEFEQNNKLAYRTILVHFENEDDISNFSELIGQNITDKTKYLYYPQQVKNELKSISYVNEP